MLMPRGLVQERQESGGHEVDLRDISPVGLLPFLERGIFRIEQVLSKLFGIFTSWHLIVARDSRIVDQDA
jgi:hypothetical protein